MKTIQKINYNFSFELPLPRTYHSSNYDEKNNLIYIYGGTDMNINHCKGENFQALWKFDLIEKIWYKINLEPKLPDGPPRGHVSIFLKNKIYIIGGVTLFKKFKNSMYIINLIENSIELVDYNNESFKKGIIPEPLAFQCAVLLNEEKILIHGGLNKNYNAINTCYIYYINEMKFDKISIPLIPNLFGHKIVRNCDTNKLYIIGGMDSFQYVGDKNLIYQNKEESNNLFNINEGKIIFKPMLNIFEISLEENKNNNIPQEEGEIEAEKKNKNTNKKIRWKKLFYVNKEGNKTS